jgi:hypothetical protein
MTVAQTILSFPGLEDINPTFLEKTLIVRSLNGADNYSAAVDTQVNLAAADLYVVVVNSPDFSENKLSITHPRSFYTATAVRLYRENGEPAKAKALSQRITVSGKSTTRW